MPAPQPVYPPTMPAHLAELLGHIRGAKNAMLPLTKVAHQLATPVGADGGEEVSLPGGLEEPPITNEQAEMERELAVRQIGLTLRSNGATGEVEYKLDTMSVGAGQQRESFSLKWEQMQSLLAPHYISCLRDQFMQKRNCFQHVFYVIREIRTGGYDKSSAALYFMPEREGMGVFSNMEELVQRSARGRKASNTRKQQGRQPLPPFSVQEDGPGFMNEYFLPVARALNNIFNWRKLIVDVGADDERRRLLDDIKTSCRSLVRIANSVAGQAGSAGSHRPTLSYWIPSAVVWFANLYKPDDLSSLKELAKLLALMETRMMWVLYTGGNIAFGANPGRTPAVLLSGGHVSTGVMRMAGGRGGPGRRRVKETQEVLGVLKLSSPQGKVLENNFDPVSAALQLVPLEQKALAKRLLEVKYNYGAGKEMRQANLKMGKGKVSDQLAVYNKSGTKFLSTDRLSSWLEGHKFTLAACAARDEHILTTVAKRLGIAETIIPELAPNRWEPAAGWGNCMSDEDETEESGGSDRETQASSKMSDYKREYPEVKGMDAQAAKEKLEKEYDGLNVSLREWDGPPDSPKPMPLIFNPQMVWIWYNPESNKAVEARAFC
ncbi:hypothetical protein WJX72_002797 [[Myrmecia] bisecta]|uniref:Uncharacterized protein n=1 Tax=[Myrmecia] bisecta TaxID=41462 RepID=A0AAW1P810_9CHLO